MPSAHVYLCTEDIFQVVLFTINKNKSWLKFILVSVFCIGNILWFLENLMLFSYFNSMCISMYLLSELYLDFFKKKCVQKRNVNTDL